MALYTVALNQTAEPLDVNQLVNTLQQPSGGVETSKYYWTFWASANAQTSGMYVATRSRGSTPVSVFIDHADGFPATINAPLYSNVTSNGFEVYASANAASNNNGVGGNWTVQY